MELVVVERAGDGGLVAGGAEFCGLVEGAHYGLLVAIEVGKNLGVGDRARDGRAFFIDKHRGDTHDVTAGARGVSGLDGVADGAGDAFILERALLGHAL